MKRDTKVGTLKQRKKDISISLIKAVQKYQKHLQIQENIKFGRKAKHISFVFATKKPKSLAKFIVEELK